jgi:hypothetical protein
MLPPARRRGPAAWAAWWCMLLLLAALAAPEALVNTLPEVLLSPPKPLSPDAPSLSGLVDPATTSSKPMAMVGYISPKGWALQEFIAMTHASWSYLQHINGGFKIDIFAFASPQWEPDLSKLCTTVDLDRDFATYADPSSACYAIYYPEPPDSIWHGYPFINNIHFFIDPRVQKILTSRYGLVMKSDFDTFLTPALLRARPKQFSFGIQVSPQLLPSQPHPSSPPHAHQPTISDPPDSPLTSSTQRSCSSTSSRRNMP